MEQITQGKASSPTDNAGRQDRRSNDKCEHRKPYPPR